MWTITNKRTGITETYTSRKECDKAAREHLNHMIMIDGKVQKNTDTYLVKENGSKRAEIRNR